MVSPYAVIGGVILSYGVITTCFQYWIVTLVEERARRRDRFGLAWVNLALMPAGQALALAVVFDAAGRYVIPSSVPSHLTAEPWRIFSFWVSALAGFFFVGLLLTVLPVVGKYFREPEVSIFCGGLFIAVAYKAPGLASGLREAWVFGRDHPLMTIGLLVLGKGISLACRYGIGLPLARRGTGPGRRNGAPRLALALVLGASSTLMLIPLLALLRGLAGIP